MRAYGLDLQSKDWWHNKPSSFFAQKSSHDSIITAKKVIWSATLLAFLISLTYLVYLSNISNKGILQFNGESQVTEPELINEKPLVSQPSNQVEAVTVLENDTLDGNSSASSTAITSLEAVTNNGETTININSQSVEVPQNGNISKEVISDDGQTSMNISVSNSSDTDSSSTSVYINSNSSNISD
jgi:hypothetical protein